MALVQRPRRIGAERLRQRPVGASLHGGRLRGPELGEGRRMVLRGGRLVDPANGIDGVRDLVLVDRRVAEVAEAVASEPCDRIVDVEGLVVVPGLVEVHVHLHDLFEVTTPPIYEAVAHGTTLDSRCVTRW